MNRIDKMMRSLQLFQTEWMKGKVKACQRKQEDELLSLARNLLSCAQEKQKKSELGSIAYLTLFHLNSSLWTGSYRYKIIVADESLYLDTQQLSCDWTPRYLYEDVQQLQNAVEKELRKHYVRLVKYEIEQITRNILSEYQMLAEVYWSQAAGEIIKSDEFKGLDIQSGWKIIYGNYMGELKIIAQSEKGSVA